MTFKISVISAESNQNLDTHHRYTKMGKRDDRSPALKANTYYTSILTEFTLWLLKK